MMVRPRRWEKNSSTAARMVGKDEITRKRSLKIYHDRSRSRFIAFNTRISIILPNISSAIGFLIR